MTAYSLYHQHGQDKTVLSCLVCVGGVNTTADKTRQFCLVLTQFPISKFLVILNVFCFFANWKLGRDKTKLSCLVTICVHTADTDKKRQGSFVLCEQAIKKNVNYVRYCRLLQVGLTNSTMNRKTFFFCSYWLADNLHMCTMFISVCVLTI